MITTFSFTNPDGTAQVLDLISLFPIGGNSSRIRGYGISLARRYSDVCAQIYSIVNELYHQRFDDDVFLDLSSPDDVVERIGIMLGQQIHKHLLHSEETGDIWAEVCNRLLVSATGARTPAVHILFGELNTVRLEDV